MMQSILVLDHQVNQHCLSDACETEMRRCLVFISGPNINSRLRARIDRWGVARVLRDVHARHSRVGNDTYVANIHPRIVRLYQSILETSRRFDLADVSRCGWWGWIEGVWSDRWGHSAHACTIREQARELQSASVRTLLACSAALPSRAESPPDMRYIEPGVTLNENCM